MAVSHDLGGTKTALVLDGGGIVERCRIDTDAVLRTG